MKLLTKEILSKLPPLETEINEDSLIQVKYFNPAGSQTWYGVTYDPETRVFFGYVEMGLGSDELGYFSLNELESLQLPFGLSIERDLYFTPIPLKEVTR